MQPLHAIEFNTIAIAGYQSCNMLMNVLTHVHTGSGLYVHSSTAAWQTYKTGQDGHISTTLLQPQSCFSAAGLNILQIVAQGRSHIPEIPPIKRLHSESLNTSMRKPSSRGCVGVCPFNTTVTGAQHASGAICQRQRTSAIMSCSILSSFKAILSINNM